MRRFKFHVSSFRLNRNLENPKFANLKPETWNLKLTPPPSLPLSRSRTIYCGATKSVLTTRSPPPMADKFDPYREALVMETNTIWPADLADLPSPEKRRIEDHLHANPAACL